MPEILTLEQRKTRFAEAFDKCKHRIVICAGTGCMAGGSMKIYHRFREVLKSRGLSVTVALEKEQAEYTLTESGCQGFCQQGPLVTIKPEGIIYTKVSPDDVGDS